jgi:cytosine/adenosine deaminase-related metal-dependent hydrolase
MTTQVVAGKYVLCPRDGTQLVLNDVAAKTRGHVLLQDHYIYVDGAKIEAVTRDAPAPGQQVIRYDHGLVMPGFVNLHAHCIRGGLFRGIPDDLEMEPFVPKLVYNILLPLTALAAEELTAEELRAVTALGMIDLLKGGTTTVLDMWHHGQDIFFDVARELGLRTVGAPFIMSASNARLGPDGHPVWDFGNDGLAQLQKSVALFKARDEGREGLAEVAIGPHATDTCLPELLRECRKAADDLGCILTTHFAQTRQELALLRKRYDMSAAEYARHAGLLGGNVILAHAGCASDDELGVLADTGTHVANCAFSFAREGVNFPYARFARAGINTGLGTDSHGMDFIGEMRTTGLLSKMHFGKAYVGTAHELVRAGTLAGADALNRPDLGRLAPGAKADLLVFDLWKSHLQPVWDPIKNLVWKGNAGDLTLVMVHGEPVVRNGRLLTADEPAIMRTAAVAARKIWSIAERREILPTRP